MLVFYKNIVAAFRGMCRLWHIAMRDYQTRAPRGTDRSPEYNEHFCYKLD